MDLIIAQYIEMFGSYPFFYVSGMHKDEAKRILRDAINTGVPIDPEYKDGHYY